jgi:glycine hydroxymethyltransferase
MIMCKEEFAKKVDKAVFPGMQGGPHDHITAAKAVAFGEAQRPEFKDYAKQVIINSRAMAQRFIDLGYRIISGGTDNHLFVIDLSSKGLVGKKAENILEKIGVSVSRSTIPDDPNPPMNPSGIRIGTAAVTSRGMKETEMIKIANLIHEALQKEEEQELKQLKEEIKILCRKFSLPAID